MLADDLDNDFDKNSSKEIMDWSNVYNDYDSVIDFMSKNG